MKNYTYILLAAGAALALTACQPKTNRGANEVNRDNLVTLGNPQNKDSIGEAGKQFLVKTLAEIQNSSRRRT